MTILPRDCRRWRKEICARVAEGVAGERDGEIESHLAACGDCQRYAEELRGAAAGLRRLARQEVEPSRGFRARWTAAVETAARPAGIDTLAAALASWSRGVLRRNWRPLVALAPVWILILLLKLAVPQMAPSAPATAARSPVEVFRTLNAEQQLLARQTRHVEPAKGGSPAVPAAGPRSEKSPEPPGAPCHRRRSADAFSREFFPTALV